MNSLKTKEAIKAFNSVVCDKFILDKKTPEEMRKIDQPNRALCSTLTPQSKTQPIKSDPDVSSIHPTASVIKLQSILGNRPAGPSVTLQAMFQSCDENPALEAIVEGVKELGKLFISKYVQKNEEIPGLHEQFARQMLHLGVTLFYMILESTTADEQQKKGNTNVLGHLKKTECQKSMFACCMEIVMSSYNCDQHKFPWIIEALELKPYYFCKMIEIAIIFLQEKLLRRTVKHLQSIEEKILKSMVWQSDSPLWSEIKARKLPKLPSYEEVKLDDDTILSQKPVVLPSQLSKHFAVMRLRGQEKLQVPTVQEGADSQRSIPVPTTSQGGVVPTVQPSTPNDDKKKSKLTGSLAIFLRKFYLMASVRLIDMCKRLHIGDITVQKIWTNFEHAITDHAQELLMDRHVDQLIMCAIYSIAKVTNQNIKFSTIFHQYCETHDVYENALLNKGPNGKVDKDRHFFLLMVFYNNFFVQHMISFINHFSPDNNSDSPDNPTSLIMSPLPAPNIKNSPFSSQVRVVDGLNLFLSPLTPENSPVRTDGTLAYVFCRSPVKNLHKINNKVGNSNLAKRKLNEVENDNFPTFKFSKSSKIAKRIQEFKNLPGYKEERVKYQ